MTRWELLWARQPLQTRTIYWLFQTQQHSGQGSTARLNSSRGQGLDGYKDTGWKEEL